MNEPEQWELDLLAEGAGAWSVPWPQDREFDAEQAEEMSALQELQFETQAWLKP